MLMGGSSISLGNIGEDFAAHLLRAKGYEIIDHHVRSRFGEIDLVAENDSGMLVFIEVKTRSGDLFGSAEEALTPWKQYKLINAIEEYLSKIDRYRDDWRVDLVAVEIEKKRLKRIEHYQNVLW